MNKYQTKVRLKRVCQFMFLCVFFIVWPKGGAASDIDGSFQMLFHSLGISKINVQNDVSRMLQCFSQAVGNDDKETAMLLKRWDNYLINVTHFSNEEYAFAINKQHMLYREGVDKLGTIIIERNKQRKEAYSELWVDQLIKHFGKQNIIRDREAVRACFLYFSYAIIDEDYEKCLKETIYVENMLIGSYKTYFGYFLDFYNGQIEKKERKKLESRKRFIDAFLFAMNRAPITSMTKTAQIDQLMAWNRAYSLNKDIFRFLDQNPLMKNFDPMRASDDFERALE